jgi:hypothetical protein
MKAFRIIIIIFLFFANGTAAQKYYTTPTGAKYHLSTCHSVKNVSKEISPEGIRKTGLEPCKICKPDDVYRLSQAPKKTAQGEKKSTVQCRGLTKKGIRCKHMTSIGNGYCFQHLPKN